MMVHMRKPAGSTNRRSHPGPSPPIGVNAAAHRQGVTNHGMQAFDACGHPAWKRGGLMYEMTDALAADTELASRYTLAHENYLAERERIRLISGTDEVPEIENISAGGMPTRVKCLHAVIGHTLAVGRGINPMGDWGLDEIADWWTPQVCACEPSWRDA